MTDKMKEKILQQNQKFSENGLRVLAFAYKEVNEGKKLTLEEENGFIFVVWAAMMIHRERKQWMLYRQPDRLEFAQL